MKSSKRWFLLAVVLATFNNISAAGPFKKVSIASSTKSITSAAAAAASTTTTTTTSTTPIPEEATSDEGDEKSDNNNSTGHLKNSKLTGIPQIDYIWDPNLPRELRGYNLSSYPFFATVPPEEDIHFKCDGLHDGFYASIEHKCQVYHHCVYGIRHDFLCANFTAFDQKTFICHFVSDVDCEGSQKYWNRNDDLYMATTTTSTTTTTTEPPPTPKRRPVRPLRPLRRPVNRRPIDDYYYDEEEYDEDYYEERLNRRRKQRPRHRKPMVDYEDDYLEDEKHTADLRPRRPNSRDRFRDDPDIEIDDDYETERRKIDRTKPRNKPVATAERRKISNRKPGSLVGRANADERRSLSEDRPLTSRKKSQTALTDEFTEPVESPPRRLAGRKRVNDRRPPPTPSTATDFDDLDEYEKPHAHAFDQDADAAEEDVAPKLKTTTKPLEEFITPKAAPSSVYARPRAPPRIARPVPINEKKKFQYPVQKTATTVRPPLASSQDDEPDYYEDEDYVDVPAQRGHSRRRIVDDVPIEEDELPLARRRNQKPTRTLRKPTIEPKKSTTVADEEDYGVEERYVSRGVNRRRNGYLGRTRNRAGANDDVDFFDDEYDERPARRSRPNGRKGAKKPRIPEPSEEVDEEEFESELEQKPLRSRPSTVSTGRRKNAPSLQSRSRSPTPPPVTSDESESGQVEDADPPTASGKNQATINRPASVRVVKRPFLPSRGGSPYLPRGLQPVGVALKPLDSQTTDTSPSSMQINMGSTISGVHLLEHGVPLLREAGPRTTLPPRSPLPVSQPRPEPQTSNKATLDELYETDYDVTLNDALNPTLKPLSPHQPHHNHHNQPQNNNQNNNRPYQNGFSSSDPFVNSNPSSAANYHYHQSVPPSPSSSHQTLSQSQSYHQQPQQQQQQSNENNNFNSDSYFSSTDIRRRTIISPPQAQSRNGYGSRMTSISQQQQKHQHYYDEYEY